MAERDLMGIETTAKIGSHPMHPMLIPFPIAFLVAAFVCDLVFWRTGNGFWAQVAFWALAAALVMAALAALAGLADFFGNERIRDLSDAWQHMIGNVIAVVLALINFGIRYYRGVEAGVFPWGILLSAVVVLILLFTGWKGWEMVYRHRVGVAPEMPGRSGVGSTTSHRAEAR